VSNENNGHSVQSTEKEAATNVSVFVRKYKPTMEDVTWAQNGVVATVINGEAISVVQNRITDAGFKELAIIPMGADKVLIRSMADVDVAITIDGAKDFFNLFFSNWTRWNKEVVSSQR
ncbi:sulfate transporter, partial [Trifolium medium]|nr:sulfate transporter [Trifolium medium]